MTLQQLRYLIAIAEHQSFVKAAESCHVAQPNLSVQIQQLEDELGVNIFVRSPQRGVVPTEIGKQIIDQAKIVLAESDRLVSLGHISQDLVQGKIKLGMIPTIGPFLSPHFLKPLLQKYPASYIGSLSTRRKLGHI
jgi:LysR family hydrogen peroxide-inducible transcriptional activator